MNVGSYHVRELILSLTIFFVVAFFSIFIMVNNKSPEPVECDESISDVVYDKHKGTLVMNVIELDKRFNCYVLGEDPENPQMVCYEKKVK